MKILDKLEQLRDFVWGYDISSSTIPEYIEHHECIQAILRKIDLIIEEETE